MPEVSPLIETLAPETLPSLSTSSSAAVSFRFVEGPRTVGSWGWPVKRPSTVSKRLPSVLISTSRRWVRTKEAKASGPSSKARQESSDWPMSGPIRRASPVMVISSSVRSPRLGALRKSSLVSGTGT